MGYYNGRGYYGRRHGGGFFFLPLLFVGFMALFFLKGLIFFFLPLIMLGFFGFVAFAAFRFMFGQHDGMNQWGNREGVHRQWSYGDKRKNSPDYFTDQHGERWEVVEDEKNKRYPNDTDFV